MADSSANRTSPGEPKDVVSTELIEQTHLGRSGGGFSIEEIDGRRVYVDEYGRGVDAEADLHRIKLLAIPPAWKDVWIASSASDHLQAVGVDTGGKHQYLYSATWHASEAKLKFDRALELATKIPSARAQVNAHLRETADSKRRTLAAAFRMLDTGSLRVGSERYAEEHGSFGLATLLGRHATILGPKVTLRFPAKSHHAWESEISDPQLSRVVASLKEAREGDILLAYRVLGVWHPLGALGINDYVKEQTGEQFSAKDFRTLHGTLAAAQSLASSGPIANRAERLRAVAESIRAASATLQNTPAVARSSYVDPRLINRFLSGESIVFDGGPPELQLVRFLRSSPSDRA
jgi:DNA topoisomerase-1